MKKPHLNIILSSNQSGVILIWLVFIMVVAGILGSSIVSLSTSSTYSELFKNNEARAYYVAEAGGRYAVAQIRKDPLTAVTNLPTNTPFTLNPSGAGDNFRLLLVDISSDPMKIISEGIVNEGGWFEGRRTITYEIVRTFCNIDDLDQVCFDNSFCILDNDTANIFCEAKVDFHCAIRFRQFNDDLKMSINLDTLEGCGTENCCILDLEAARNNNTPPSLSYEMQTKVMLVEQGANDGHHYMFGLSFRLDTKGTVDPSDDNSYGISFFKSDDSSRPRDEPWFDDLDASFDVLMPNEGEGCPGSAACSDGIDNDGDGLTDLVSGFEDPDCDVTVNPACDRSTFCSDGIDNDGDGLIDGADSDCSSGGVYIVLWREVNGVYTLLDFQLMTVSDGVIDSVTGGLKDWSTIVIRIIESGAGNTISGFVQGTVKYPRNTLSWDFSGIPFDQVIGFNDVSAFTLRSSGPPTEEMGIHAFYDNPNNNDIFFDDFTVRILGPDGKVQIRPIQY